MAYTFSESHIRHKNHVFVPTAPRGPRSKTQKPRVCTHSPQRLLARRSGGHTQTQTHTQTLCVTQEELPDFFTTLTASAPSSLVNTHICSATLLAVRFTLLMCANRVSIALDTHVPLLLVNTLIVILALNTFTSPSVVFTCEIPSTTGTCVF